MSLDGTGQTRSGITGQVRFRALARACAEGGTVGSEGGKLTVAGANSVTLLVSIGTSYTDFGNPTGDHTARAAAPLNVASDVPFTTLRKRHIDDYRPGVTYRLHPRLTARPARASRPPAHGGRCPESGRRRGGTSG